MFFKKGLKIFSHFSLRSFADFSHNFTQRVCTENVEHFLFAFVIFALPFNDKEDTVNDFSFQGTICIIHFDIENLESSLGWIIELRRSPVGMHNKINQNFFDFAVFGLCKALNNVLYPNFSMIFHILPNQFVKIFSDDESLVSDSIDDTRNKNHVVLFFLAII